MTQLKEILSYNEAFVKNEEYKPYETSKFPNKELAIVTCMDTRLIELLPKALNIHNGDAKMIKNAGGMIETPYDSAMKSLLVAIYELKAREVLIIGHHKCGMIGLKGENMIEHMKEQGLNETSLNHAKSENDHLETWLNGFGSVEERVKKSVETVKNHPLMPRDIPVHGLVICPETGKLDLVVEDNK
ncbi:carbonic anhydrase [Scopulibacillus daqui]|uniref:carbonic anhydrase n=1 Tax=Scopulibacillus daqui TaxID=1469162 RepID=A0ABS2Q3N0_9BACL|nr:carbonic anhydrase [Scopulibacillus daqui]MBM7646907.1 carbonic anhydrase [Scopulibacillus daqui]